MVKLLLYVLTVGLLFSAHAQGQETELYLSARERAFVALSLRTYVQGITPETASLHRRVQEALSSQTTTVKVKSYEEFIKIETASVYFSERDLNTVNEADLLHFIKPVKYVCSSDRIQRKIDTYLQSKDNFRNTALLALGGVGLQALAAQSTMEPARLEVMIRQVVDNEIQKFSSQLAAQNSKQVLLLTKLLKLYFTALPNKQKAQIAFKILELPLNSKPIDVFLVMVQNSGPQMQKLMQILGRHKDIPPEFRGVFQKLESNVKKVPWFQVEKLLLQEGLNPSEFAYFGRDPLGVGTMAQAHRAQYFEVTGHRNSSVFRFIKPGIEELLEMDHQILISIADQIDSDPELIQEKLPSLKRIIEDLHESVVEELDLERTVRNQQKGAEAYNGEDSVSYSRIQNSIKFHVPNARLRGANNKFMEQELVFGAKASKEADTYREHFPDLYPAIAEKIAEHWFQQVLFESGFFHADLHQGNFLVKYTDGAINVYLLDFGMVGQLNQAQRESSMLLNIGVIFNNHEVIAKHMNALSKQQLEGRQFADFAAKVEQRSQLANVDKTLNGWILWTMEQHLDLQYDFLKLNRGLTAIETLLMDSQSNASLKKVVERVILKNKVSFAKILARENLFRFSDFAKLAEAGAQAVGGRLQPQRPPPKAPTKVRCEILLQSI